MNKLRPIIVMDADGIIAQTNLDDVHHLVAARISARLATLDAYIIYPSSAILEAVTHMQRVLNDSLDAFNTVKLLTDSGADVVDVGGETLKLAIDYFGTKQSKKNTMFDCVVAAVAQEKGADAIFSFDKFYKSQGFKLAGEL